MTTAKLASSLFKLALCLSLGCTEQGVDVPEDKDAGGPPLPWAPDACVTTPTTRPAPQVYSPVVDASVPLSFGGANDYCNTTVYRCPPTKGPLPPEAIDSTGRMVWENVPDFVAALDNKSDRIAGYVSRYDLNCGGDGSIDVWDESLQHVVGQMVPERGFVRAK